MKLIRDIFKKNNPEKLAEELEEKYKRMKKEGEENPIDKTAQNVEKKIQENPEVKNVEGILKAVKDNEGIPDRVFEKVAIMISKSKEIPDSVIPDVVQRSDTNTSDESISRIVGGGKFGLKEKINLIKNIEDEKIVKENVKNELKILYKVCKDKKDSEVVERIETLKELLSENEVSPDIQNLIRQVVAKKMAENYYTLKATSIYGFIKIMPVEKMLEEDLPTSVEKEYIEIEKERESKENFDKKKFKELILNEMAKEIIGEHNKTGVFVIPHIKGITKEEEKYCIEKIQAMHNKKLSKKEIIDIENQIEGKSTDANQHEKALMESIRKMSNKKKEESIAFLTRRLESEEGLTTLSMMEESGLIDKLNELPEDKRKKTIEIMGRAIDKRKNITVVKPPRIEKQKLKVHPKEPEVR